MQFSVERQTLLKSLAHTQGVVERQSTIPILSNVMLVAEGHQVQTTGTDMDMALDQKLDAQIVHPGATTVSAHMLHDIVRKLPEESEIEFDTGTEREGLEIRTGRSRLSLPTRDANEFPVIEPGELPYNFTLPAKTLSRLIDQTRFAISNEETRYYLNGIFFHALEDDGPPLLRVVATDGHRLARTEYSLPEGASGMPSVIIPRKTINEIRRLIGEDAGSDSEVEVSLSDTKARISFKHATLTSKLIDGKFPDYNRVIPTGNDKTLEIGCAEFTKAVDLVSTVSSDNARIVKLSLQQDHLVLSATSPDTGSAQEEMDVGYGHGALEIGFNARYLLDITQQIGGERAEFRLSDGAAPTIIQDAEDHSALFVLMPMRV